MGLGARHKRSQPGTFLASRANVVAIVFSCLFVAIVGRAFYLHLFPTAKQTLHDLADRQYQRSIELAPYRGTIYDRRGDPLAISIRRPSLAINPRVFSPTAAETHRLAKLLNQPVQTIAKLDQKQSYFAWLARQIDHRIADEVMSLQLPGLFLWREPARYYPAGTAAAQLLGFVGLDNAGLGGLERQFDRDLRGQALHVTATKDARGQFIFNETLGAAPEKTGNSLYLTLDRVIQEIAEDAVEEGVKNARAKQGYAIVLDPHTGKILAIANYPTFDPNDRNDRSNKTTRNHALLDTFEPGSTTKPFIIAEAISRGATRIDEVHDCENGALRIGRHIINDDHPDDVLTTADTILRSSNICTYKIAAKIGKEGTFQALRKFGIGTNVGSLGFPGESRGYVTSADKWREINFANISFGHGFVTTGLEIASAMGTFANGGQLIKPSIVDRVVSSDGLVVTSPPPEVLGRAVDPETARDVRRVLQRVVDEKRGTATRAATELFTTAGKTGTAQKVEPGVRGYSKDKRIASFVGFAPVEDPHLVVYVLIDEPGNKPYYGGLWAAPVFSQIVDRTLKYLNVAPDKQPKPEAAPPAAKPPVARTTPHDGTSTKM
jgi:cell division protein FtsI (penicillin-binding protein 3)